MASWFETAQERLLTMRRCNDGAHSIARGPDCAEPVIERRFAPTRPTLTSFPDVQVHIVDAPLGAGPESILPVVVMDSGLARSLSSGRALRGPVGAPRNDGSQLNWLFEN
jgi:hypothetical protein